MIFKISSFSGCLRYFRCCTQLGAIEGELGHCVFFSSGDPVIELITNYQLLLA